MLTLSPYTESGLLQPSPVTLDFVAAGRRACARHETAFTPDPSSKGLHEWDINLRSEGNEMGRQNLIKATEKDMYDAVCELYVGIIDILTFY